MKHILILLAVLALCNVNVAFAQANQDMNKEVEVIKAYQPSINAAQKISENPKIIDTVNYTPFFDYKIFTSTVKVEKSVNTIPAVKLGTPPLHRSNTGYAKLAAGNSFSPYAELFINSPVSRITDYGLQLLHFSSQPKIKLEDNLKIKAPYNDNLVKMFTKSTFRKSVLDWDLGYSRSGFRYYGFTGDSTLYYNITPDSLIGKPNAQALNTAFTNFNLKNINSRSNLKYDVGLGYYFFWIASGQKEHNAQLDGTFDFDNRKINIVTEAKLEYHYTDSIFNNFDLSKKSHQFVNVAISPQYVIKRKKLELMAGLNLGSLIDNDTSAIYHLSPKVDLQFHPIEGTLTLFAGTDGGINPYFLKNSLEKNRYYNYSLLHAPSEKAISLYGGFKGNILNNFSYMFDVDYSVVQNDAFYYLKQSIYPTSQIVGNLFDAEYGDINILRFGANLRYSSNSFKIGLSGNYYIDSSKDISIFSHQPDFDISVNTFFKVNNKISAFIDADITGPMDVKHVTYDYSTLPLGSLSDPLIKVEKIELPIAIDINLGVNYAYSKKLGFFAKANNLLNKNNEIWHGYNSPGLLLMLGASYTF